MFFEIKILEKSRATAVWHVCLLFNGSATVCYGTQNVLTVLREH